MLVILISIQFDKQIYLNDHPGENFPREMLDEMSKNQNKCTRYKSNII
jgi:hypothetical protein